MAWDGIGTFSRFEGTTGCATKAAGGTGITAALEDQRFNEFATGINNCLTKDGQNAPTANLPMGGFKHTNVADGTADTDGATYGQIKNNFPRIFSRAVSDVTVTNTTTLTSVGSHTITGGVLGTTRGIRYRLIGYVNNNTGTDKDVTVQILFGGTLLMYATQTIPTAGASRQVDVTFEVYNDNSASAQVIAGLIHISEGAVAGTTAMYKNAPWSNYTAASVNTASDQAADIKVQFSAASANLTFVAKYSFVEII